jgi:hypothetical protein
LNTPKIAECYNRLQQIIVKTDVLLTAKGKRIIANDCGYFLSSRNRLQFHFFSNFSIAFFAEKRRKLNTYCNLAVNIAKKSC